jgi:DNA-binding NarL/FixJ family response regulator
MRRVMAAPEAQAGRPAIRVVVADDSALFREGIRAMLTHAGFEVAGLAANAGSLLTIVADTEPDVAITDIRMPPRSPAKAWTRPAAFGPRIHLSGSWCCRPTSRPISRRRC